MKPPKNLSVLESHKGNDYSVIIRPEDTTETPLANVHDDGYLEVLAAAPELLDALLHLNAFVNDLSKSNPGYLRKLCLQDYGQMNEVFLKTSKVLRKLGFGEETKASQVLSGL